MIARAGEALPHVSRTVLVADDHERVLRWATRVFVRAGWRAVGVASGEAALAAWAREHDAGGRVDLLVTDLVMPGMTGLELATRLRSRVAALPIIAVTGQEDCEQEWHRASLRASAVFLKPVTSSELLDAAQRLTVGA